jgi:TolB-like protein
MRKLLLALALLIPSIAKAGDQRPTVAVLYFDYSGKDPEMAVLKKGLAQMLISDLSSVDQIRLVERDRLEEILAELKLGQSAKIDPQTAAKVGKLLGARYMVLGGYFDLMQTLRADARVVEVETGKVIQSTGASGKPEDFLTVEQSLSQALAKILAEKTQGLAKEPGKLESPTVKPKIPMQKGGIEGAKTARATPPKALSIKTAVKYSKALHAIDKGDKEGARKELQAVVKEQPDFRLATLDMDRLIQ